MKEELIKVLKKALSGLEEDLDSNISQLKVEIKQNKKRQFGDYSSNIAMLASKKLSQSPKEIAEHIKREVESKSFIKKVEVAEPGFINFFLTLDSRTKVLKVINEDKASYGLEKNENRSSKEKVLIEYVSSNPTGPLHVGHARGAAFGSVLSNILRAAGFEVDEEYYINDQGRQMDILALSVWIRYLQHFYQDISFPAKCYKGLYVTHLAKELVEKNKEKFLLLETSKGGFVKNISKDIAEDSELDLLIENSKNELKDNFKVIKTFALKSILNDIKKDLKDFGVKQNLWFIESSMFDSSVKQPSLVDIAIKILSDNGFIYKKEGAEWFRSTDYKDEKDRVVRRENGLTTYFASDIAYHLNKYQRGYDKIINVWGADHHGYLPRVKAAISALKLDVEKFEVVFIQFANLVRNGKKASMSTREGEFISLRLLIEEVTSEAARFFFVNRKGDQHLDFDLDLAKEESKDNPLYYIQYAHARICSVFTKLEEKNRSYNETLALKSLQHLNGEKEVEILQALSQFPEVIQRAANNYEPHLICYFLRNLASSFHGYYNDEKLLVEGEEELQAKLFMLSGVKQVIFNGLSLLGISSPKSM